MKRHLLQTKIKLLNLGSKKGRLGNCTKMENSCKHYFQCSYSNFSRNFEESEIRIGVVWRSLCLNDENQYQEWRKNRNTKSSQDAVDILKKKLEADKKPVPSRIFH